MKIIKIKGYKDGNKCNCGNNGCFETYASMKRFKNKVIDTPMIDFEKSRGRLK
jgi:predicted NBD/HSP70 family sugar kinase